MSTYVEYVDITMVGNKKTHNKTPPLINEIRPRFPGSGAGWLVWNKTPPPQLNEIWSTVAGRRPADFERFRPPFLAKTI